jgi:hypothetical protein
LFKKQLLKSMKKLISYKNLSLRESSLVSLSTIS